MKRCGRSKFYVTTLRENQQKFKRPSFILQLCTARLTSTIITH